ncbi:MAG TPA: DUF3857 domain-containing protein [Terracidiphilus sp.]|nr:DUF3857 domain-containing protein [Terracidiphilus sp.]
MFALVLSCTCACAGAQAAAKPTAPNTYASEALVFEHLDTAYRMHQDGTGERDLHVVLRIQSDGAAQQFGVLAFSYASAYETPKFKFVRVHKADGSVVETPASDAIDMPAEVSREAPLYSDLKEKQLPIRSLARGDTLEYEVDTTIDKAEAPGQFWGMYHFDAPGSVIVLSETLTLEAPAAKYVQVWSPNHPPQTAEHDGLRTWTWKAAQLVTAPRSTGDDTDAPTPPKDPDEDADGRKLPSVAWTTFHSWSEVGDWYRSLALPEAQPNDALRARADEITANAKTPEEQVRAIYDYVAAHTRYIGIDFGIGRYKPHAAIDVLTNQYGDCKDKDTLLEALLHAKGFSTASALIGAGIAPVPDVPSPAVFNHVITTVNLPGGRIWLDSTPLAAPFQYLVAILRDQKALVVPADGPATLVTTPAAPPYALSERFEATGTLDAEGKMMAKMVSTYRDDDEVVVRSLARGIAPAEWDKASQFISSNTGFGGTTSNTQFANVDDPSQPIVVKYDYQRHPFGDWDNLRIVPLFPALPFKELDKDAKEPDDDIQLGAARTLVAITHIRLPDGYRPDMPDPIHVKTDFATFDKTYRFEGNEIIAERTIVVLKTKLPRSDWQRYKTFTKDISLDGEAWIQLMKPSPKIQVTVVPSGKSVPPVPPPGNGVRIIQIKPGASEDATPAAPADIPSDANAADLVSKAMEKARSGDWSGARAELDAAKAKNPQQRGLWATYALIDEAYDRDYAAAARDFSKEMAQQPDNAMVAGALADAQNRSGDGAGARKTLQQFLEGHPENTRLAFFLVSLQTTAGDNESALKTIETAVEHNSDDRNLRIQEGEALVRLGRYDEAAAAAKSALDGADDAGTFNDAAYVLSEANRDLDVAEQASMKGIAKLDEQSTTQSAGEANSAAFGRANLLVASWDTLGWILFREGKLQEAHDWLAPAWRASLRPEIADHLAQVEEALHHKDDAALYYALAQAAMTSSNVTPEIRRHILDGVHRMKAEGAKPGPADGAVALQNLRTFKLARPEGASGWGTFRIEISTAGVADSQQMSGDHNMAKAKPAIDAMKFPELLPPASKAHLLRSAVISCSMGKTCELVFVLDGGLNTEQQ